MDTPLQQIDIAIKQRHILQFDNLQKDITASTATENSISVSHDLEKMEDDSWLVHVDIWLTIPEFARAFTRIVYSLTCAEEAVFAEGVSREYIKPALQLCREVFNKGCQDGGIDARLPESFVSEERINVCYELLMDGVNKMKETHANCPIGKSDYFFINPSDHTNIVASGTLVILDQVMFLNPSFNRIQNREVLGSYIPLPYYFTVKNKLVGMLRDKSKPGLSMKQLVIYIWMVQCALSILLSDHGDNMSEEIAKAGLTEEQKDNYIKCATSSLKEINKILEKGGVTITNLQEKNDWVGMIG